MTPPDPGPSLGSKGLVARKSPSFGRLNIVWGMRISLSGTAGISGSGTVGSGTTASCFATGVCGTIAAVGGAQDAIAKAKPSSANLLISSVAMFMSCQIDVSSMESTPRGRKAVCGFLRKTEPKCQRLHKPGWRVEFPNPSIFP